LGALVLAQSLKATQTPYPLVVLYSPDHITQQSVTALQSSFDQVIPIQPIQSQNIDNLELLGRPDLIDTFSKLYVWNLIQFQKVVFLDADILVLQNVDELMQQEELSAVPDCGWPDVVCI
jgi:alpha-N-acetylglucosamine transferase